MGVESVRYWRVRVGLREGQPAYLTFRRRETDAGLWDEAWDGTADAWTPDALGVIWGWWALGREELGAPLEDISEEVALAQVAVSRDYFARHGFRAPSS